MAARAEVLLDIARRHQPATVRGLFYQATVAGLVEKDEAGYGKVQRMLVELRRAGRLPYAWIADSTRLHRKPVSYSSVEEAVENAARTYRRAVWADLDTYLEVWCEKDALAGTLYPVTSRYDVPLMTARGYSSLTALHGAASYMQELGKRVLVLHFGDHDPSGRDAADKIEATLRQFAPKVELVFHRLAVTTGQIERWRLPGRPTKRTDSRSKRWTGGDSVELDAIEPNMLRGLCERAIEEVIPKGWLDALKVAEESERGFLRQWGEALTSESRP